MKYIQTLALSIALIGCTTVETVDISGKRTKTTSPDPEIARIVARYAAKEIAREIIDEK